MKNREVSDVGETIGALVRHGVYSEIRQGDSKIHLRPIMYSTELNLVQWELKANLSSGPFVIAMYGYNAVITFLVKEYLHHNERLTIPCPTEIEKVRQRWQRRKNVNDLFFRHKRKNGTSELYEVRDVSYSGLALHRYADEQYLNSVTAIDGALLLPSGKEIEVHASVVETSVSDSGAVCHLHIGGIASQDWIDVVNDRLHPGTKMGTGYGQELWNLYTECGYLALAGTTPEDFRNLRTAYDKVVNKIGEVPQLGCHVVWPNATDARGVNATLSVLKTYRHSWFGLQLSRISGVTSDGISGRKVLREIHLRCYEHAQQDPDLRWIIAYSHIKRYWTRMLHHDLPERYVESGEACIVRFRALQFPIDAFDMPQDLGCSTTKATKEELLDVARCIGTQRSNAYCEALDLVAERMAMSDVIQQFKSASLERDRIVFITRENGVPKAAAIAEVAADGLHVYGLFNLVRLYPMTAEGAQYYPDLLAQCAKWFQSKGKQNFSLSLEDGQTLCLKTQALATDMGLADMAILSAKRMPEFFEYLYEVTSPRPTKIEISEPAPQ